jgi:hypothetical protein
MRIIHRRHDEAPLKTRRGNIMHERNPPGIHGFFQIRRPATGNPKSRGRDVGGRCIGGLIAGLLSRWQPRLFS